MPRFDPVRKLLAIVPADRLGEPARVLGLAGFAKEFRFQQLKGLPMANARQHDCRIHALIMPPGMQKALERPFPFVAVFEQEVAHAAAAHGIHAVPQGAQAGIKRRPHVMQVSDPGDMPPISAQAVVAECLDYQLRGGLSTRLRRSSLANRVTDASPPWLSVSVQS